jgi:hypothetical protein
VKRGLERETGLEPGYAHFGPVLIPVEYADVFEHAMDAVRTRSLLGPADRWPTSASVREPSLPAARVPKAGRRRMDTPGGLSQSVMAQLETHSLRSDEVYKVRWAANLLGDWCGHRRMTIPELDQAHWRQFTQDMADRFERPSWVLHYVGLVLQLVDESQDLHPDEFPGRHRFGTYASPFSPNGGRSSNRRSLSDEPGLATRPTSTPLPAAVRDHSRDPKLGRPDRAGVTLACKRCATSFTSPTKSRRYCETCRVVVAKERRRQSSERWHETRRWRVAASVPSRLPRTVLIDLLPLGSKARRAAIAAVEASGKDAKNTRVGIALLFSWCGDSGIDPTELTPEAMGKYSDWLHAQYPHSATSRKAYAMAFYRHLGD